MKWTAISLIPLLGVSAGIIALHGSMAAACDKSQASACSKTQKVAATPSNTTVPVASTTQQTAAATQPTTAPMDAGMRAYLRQMETLTEEIRRTELVDPEGVALAAARKRLQMIETNATKRLSKMDKSDGPGSERDVAKRQVDRLTKAFDTKLNPLRTQLRNLQKRGSPPGMPVAYALADKQSIDQFIHRRGEPDQHGPVVKRRPPEYLGG